MLDRAEAGATLANRGCRIEEGRRWRRVVTGGGLVAWAAGDYLRE